MFQEHFDEELFIRRIKDDICRLSLKSNSAPTKRANNMPNEFEEETTTVREAVDNIASDAPDTTVPMDDSDATTPNKHTVAIVSSLLPSATDSDSSAIDSVTSALENVTISDRPESPSSLTDVRNALSTAAVTDSMNCTARTNCLLNDDSIKNKNIQIKGLRRRLKKSTRKGLAPTISKKQVRRYILEIEGEFILKRRAVEKLDGFDGMFPMIPNQLFE